ncbi:MAG: hypothetical protein ABI391_05180 [Hyphomicrobiaceae bacterium]
MLRSALCAVAATLALTSAARSTAIAQSADAPVEFNQTLLDRWLVVIPAINRYAASSDAPQTEAAAQARLEHVCAEAGFETHDQCTTTIGYVGTIFGGFDPHTRTFQDPIVKIRARIAEIEANAQLPAAAKEQMTAPMKEVITGFRHPIPAAHLQLMTANAMRIFKTLAPHGRK